ncbi:hypothetical protein [Flavobacterium sp.]|uniref:hypothetical protein n=1 Tax=Flavobacterium sp. TaxID=239 RepID=UPI0026365CD7|nr:hypothetical protein [Flavobacterium sp.]
MKKLYSTLFCFVFISFSYSQSITDSKISNTFDVKIEKNGAVINVIINDSKDKNTAQILTFSDSDSDSYISNQILQRVQSLYPSFEFNFPNVKEVTIKPKVNSTENNDEIEKKFVAAYVSINDEKQQIKILSNKLIFKKVKETSTLEGIVDLFPSKSDLTIKLKKGDDNTFSLIYGSDKSFPIDTTDDDKYLKSLNAFFLKNTSFISILLDDTDINYFKSIAINSLENNNIVDKKIKEARAGDKLSNFNYLGYIGTNFDLVEGLKAKNVFFAVNVLYKPREKKSRTGFYVSLYGNRTLSKIDSIKDISFNHRVFDSVVDGNSVHFTQNQLYNYSKTVDIDNLGAYFSPLINMKFLKLSNLNGETEFFYTPSLEFIWRRISVRNAISNIRNQRPYIIPGDSSDNYVQTLNENLQSFQYNSYDFHMGLLGFLLLHENQRISVRLNMNLGWSRSFSPKNIINTREEAMDYNTNFVETDDIFYTGKLWITEASTGVTLQAEILNTLKTPNPFYGVTLSKAFDFEKLGNFFKPITTLK